MRRGGGTRGASLVEVLISLSIAMIGMIGLFRVLASSVAGASTASKLGQAQVRAKLILESMRLSSERALACLASEKVSDWSKCEAICRAAGPSTAPSSCVYSTASMSSIAGPDIANHRAGFATSGQEMDRTLQRYFVVVSGDRSARDSFVQRVGDHLRVYQIQLTVGWNEDNSALGGAVGADHSVTFSTGVFR